MVRVQIRSGTLVGIPMLLHATSSCEVQIGSDTPVQRKKYEPPRFAGQRRVVRHIAAQIPGGLGVPIGVLLLQRLPATKEFGSSHNLLRNRGVPRFGWLVDPAFRRNRRGNGVHTRTADRRTGAADRAPRDPQLTGPSLHTKGPPLARSLRASTRDVFAASSSSDKTHRWTHSGREGHAWLGTLRDEPALERIHRRAAGRRDFPLGRRLSIFASCDLARVSIRAVRYASLRRFSTRDVPRHRDAPSMCGAWVCPACSCQRCSGWPWVA